MFVNHGVVDGAEHGGNVKTRVSHLYDIILGGTLVSISLPVNLPKDFYCLKTMQSATCAS